MYTISTHTHILLLLILNGWILNVIDHALFPVYMVIAGQFRIDRKIEFFSNLREAGICNDWNWARFEKAIKYQLMRYHTKFNEWELAILCYNGLSYEL